jgi:hypothetical protein
MVGAEGVLEVADAGEGVGVDGLAMVGFEAAKEGIEVVVDGFVPAKEVRICLSEQEHLPKSRDGNSG